ncbi:MAG: hypothetical protein ACK56F_15910, partial [bacterium]
GWNKDSRSGREDGSADRSGSGDLCRHHACDADTASRTSSGSLGDNAVDATLTERGRRENDNIEGVLLVVEIVVGGGVGVGGVVTGKIEHDDVANGNGDTSNGLDDDLMRRGRSEVSSRGDDSCDHVCVPPLGSGNGERHNNAMTLAAVAEQVRPAVHGLDIG